MPGQCDPLASTSSCLLVLNPIHSIVWPTRQLPQPSSRREAESSTSGVSDEFAHGIVTRAGLVPGRLVLTLECVE
jgi:hypothetical protein